MTTPVNGDLSSFAATLRRAEPTLAPLIEGPDPALPGESFVDRLRDAIGDANAQQVHAEHVSVAYANGDRSDLHGTMIALEQADITLRFVSNVRNRLVEAYREVMRMGA
ncbi:MAG: flagellar hook-basal body complex protein FliE [Sandaracinaceae bacterium]|nr:flagellar hook-basal body complex protein FliE [Sandaracinaceae bacterium]